MSSHERTYHPLYLFTQITVPFLLAALTFSVFRLGFFFFFDRFGKEQPVQILYFLCQYLCSEKTYTYIFTKRRKLNKYTLLFNLVF